MQCNYVFKVFVFGGLSDPSCWGLSRDVCEQKKISNGQEKSCDLTQIFREMKKMRNTKKRLFVGTGTKTQTMAPKSTHHLITGAVVAYGVCNGKSGALSGVLRGIVCFGIPPPGLE